jgi:hypothetical protein
MSVHEVFQEIQQPLVYKIDGFEPGIWSWMGCNPELNPYDEKMTFSEMTRTRELYCAIGQSEIYERLLTHQPCFSSVLLSQFKSIFDDLRNRIGDIEQLSDCFTYSDFVDVFTKILGDSFSLAQKVLDSIFEQKDYLKVIESMGLELTEQERTFLGNLAEIREK